MFHGENKRTVHILGCGKCVSWRILDSSVGGLSRERKRGGEPRGDAVLFNVRFSVLNLFERHAKSAGGDVEARV